MADISTVVIEYIVGDKELEHILQKLNIPVVSILPSEIDIDVIAYQIKPDIILINTRKVNTKIVTFILDINQVYERPIILFSDDPDIQSVNKVIKSGVSAYIVSGLESKRIKSIIDIAVARFIAKYLDLPEDRRADYESKQEGGYKALTIMEQQLQQTSFLIGEQFTTADISLYAYTNVADEGGFDLSRFPSVSEWLARIASREHYLAMP